MAEGYPFLKGHGTENDFVLLPDHDGSIHGDLDPARVRALCDRRAGIGADGVIRVVRAHAVPDAPLDSEGVEAEWFMDYRNADGSLSEMCGNGVRVLALHLVAEGLVDPGLPIPIGTRGGTKVVTFEHPDNEIGSAITVDMGVPQVLGSTVVGVGEREWEAQHVDMGNPHAVAFVDDLGQAGSLLEAPAHDPSVYPDGVNVEFVARRGPQHVAMRVHERGSGETRSCGTGACAVLVAASLADDARRGTDYRVDLPGGTLRLRWTADDRVLMTGPAVIVASGTTML